MVRTSITDRNVGLRRSLKELGLKLSSNEHLSYFAKKNARFFFRIFFFMAVWFSVYAFVTYEASYSSSTKLIIRNSAVTENYLIASRQNYLLSTTTGLRDPVLNTMEVIDSSLVVERLWDMFREKYPEELERLEIKNKKEWMKFNGGPPKGWCRFLEAKNISSTDVILASFHWTDPNVAQDALKTAIKAFQDKNLELNKLENKKRSEYIDKQVLEIEEETKKISKLKEEYKQKVHIADFKEKQRKVTNLREENVDKLNGTIARIAGREAEVARYEKLLGLTPSEALDATGIGQNKTFEKLRDALYLEYGTLASLQATYTDRSPQVQESLNRIKVFEKKLQEEARKSISTKKKGKFDTYIADFARGNIVEGMTRSYADIIFLKQKAEIQENYLNNLELELAAMPQYERELEEIIQKEKSLEKSLDILRRQQIEAHLKENETASNLFVVDEPNLPGGAKFPSIKHRIIISVIVSFIAAFFIVVVYNLVRFCGLHAVNFLDQRIKFYEDNRKKYDTEVKLKEELNDPNRSSVDGIVGEIKKQKEMKSFMDKYGPGKLLEVLRDMAGEKKASAASQTFNQDSQQNGLKDWINNKFKKSSEKKNEEES